MLRSSEISRNILHTTLQTLHKKISWTSCCTEIERYLVSFDLLNSNIILILHLSIAVNTTWFYICLFPGMGKLQMYQDHWLSTNIWGTWRMWWTRSIRPWSATPTMFHSRVSKDWGKNLTRDRCILLYVTHCYITCSLNFELPVFVILIYSY